jgi:hypothetical protein
MMPFITPTARETPGLEGSLYTLAFLSAMVAIIVPVQRMIGEDFRREDLRLKKELEAIEKEMERLLKQ